MIYRVVGIFLLVVIPFMTVAELPSEGLAAWYDFNGSAIDSSTNHNDGVVHGATLTSDRYGNANQAYFFDGKGYITVPGSESLNNITNALTIAAWIRPDAYYPGGGVTEWNELLSVLCKGLTVRQYSLQLSRYEHGWIWNMTNQVHGILRTIPDSTLGAWQHVTLTWDGNSVIAYINGKNVCTGDYAGILQPTTEMLYIGLDAGLPTPSGVTEYFKGAIDDIRIYSRALTAQEVKALLVDHAEDSRPYHTVKFDSNGGSPGVESMAVAEGQPIGKLPSVSRNYYTFLGWFTDREGGTLLSSNATVSANAVWYAHWDRIYTTLEDAPCRIDVGLRNYQAKGLPAGFQYDARLGIVTGTAKRSHARVTFSKRGEPDVVATFVIREERTPTILCKGLDGTPFPLGVCMGQESILLVLDAETGVKDLTATNLPPGMKLVKGQNTNQWSITGVPARAGNYETTISLTTKAGGRTTKKFVITVTALPFGAYGVFEGIVCDSDFRRTRPVNRGKVQILSNVSGGITANIAVAAGNYLFSSAGWDSVDRGIYQVTMRTKNGDQLKLSCNSQADWSAYQLVGSLFPAVGKPLRLRAQKNCFAQQWFFNASGDDVHGWTLSCADDAATASLTVSISSDGRAKIEGKVGSYQISETGCLDTTTIRRGAFRADFAPIISVGCRNRVLSISTNLWFDRSNSHYEGAGRSDLSE